MNVFRPGLLFVLALCAVESLHAQGTAFTYQGRLNDNGGPAGGVYDFRFSGFDTETGGSTPAVITNSAITVSNGLFTTVLDFGMAPSGNPVWLEIAVRTNGTGAFATLVPRQHVLPTPYAMFANTASNLLGNVPASALPANVATTNFVAAGFVANNNGSATNLSINGTLHVNGATNEVPLAGEKLRIVRGYVAYTGAIVSGSGFTVTSNSPGFYYINFNPPFSDYPAVSGIGGNSMSYNVIGYDKILIGIYVGSSFTPAPGTFSFIAVGRQ
jgi:hypothetical protein